ncbi:hypothetical protein H6A07_06450 [Olsenella uli]|uniref:hypothetical protein n=1 Tax=Olsenella uli TaxID=133926 RepID=UPI00195DC4DA|nr:hypothetical protein [Olsenella uli]MBM6676380.1 hypothetical protein [Olsenella uli]
MDKLLANLPTPLNKELGFFLAAEFSFGQAGIEDVFANLIVALLAIRLVRKIGPYAIDGYYLEPYHSVSRGAAMANVLYRIVAPVVITEALHLVISCLLFLLCGRMAAVDLRWLSVVTYWIVLFVIKVARRLFLAPIGFLFEALASLALCLLFDSSVVSRIVLEGLSVFDNTNVGFQMLISIGFMLVYGITSLVVGSTGFGEDTSGYLKERLEKALYGYLRHYRQVINKCKHGERFESDYLFRALFLTVMYIEDHNRPKLIRRIESVLSRVGLSKTTGIMQCKAVDDSSFLKSYYTDEESVRVAFPKLLTLWEEFIYGAAMNGSGDSNVGAVWFTSNWYSFDAEQFECVLVHRFSQIYGDYRGSKSLECDSIFAQVLDFVKNENNRNVPTRIAISSELFKNHAQLYPDTVMTATAGDLGFYGDRELEPNHGVIWSLSYSEDILSCFIRIIESLKKTNSTTIDSIRIVNNVYCRVEYGGRFLWNEGLGTSWYKNDRPKARR